MVYKGCKYIRFVAKMTFDSVAYANATGSSLYASQANKLGVSNVMSTKRAMLSGGSAAYVAQTASALTNQSGGTIGFTYE